MSGPTGIGKTRCAFEFGHLVSSEGVWISAGSLRWFDGYDGQRVAIFDDIRTKHTSFDMLLRLLDRYPLRVEFKGGFVDWNPSFIIITAPLGPRAMWNLRRDEDLDQLVRRVTIHLELTADSTYESIMEELGQYIPAFTDIDPNATRAIPAGPTEGGGSTIPSASSSTVSL
ncbi:MAG: helicase [Cressdnaviricota sp.]|nr:MAG: helicase [Cressdnaviricota sp.]